MGLKCFRGDGRVVMAFGSGSCPKFPNSRKGARVRIPFTAHFFRARNEYYTNYNDLLEIWDQPYDWDEICSSFA